MRSFYIFAFGAVILLQSCHGQAPASKKEMYNKEFDWSITIPGGFDTISAEQSTELQNKGAKAIEKTYDTKVENNAKTIFALRSGKFNFFESNYQPFDPDKDGDYLTGFKKVNDMLYHTFETQIPSAKLDSTSSQETISGLTFQAFKVTIQYPNNMVMDFRMYSRLFGKKEFTVNIATVDTAKGKLLLDAWMNSRFGR